MPVAHLLLTLSKAMTDARCQLASDVYACLAGDRLVFLDLPTNSYLCLSAENTQVALRLLSPPDVDRPNQSRVRLDSQGKASVVTQALLDRRLLTRASTAERTTNLYSSPMSAGREIALSQPTSYGMQIVYWRAFLASAVSASTKLHFWSMRKTVQSIRKRKERAGDRMKRSEAELSTLVTAFNQLRPFYPRAYLCLYDSLALLEFLSRRGFYPLWTFGVKSDPFGAHCWVQWGGLILNDSVARVNQYTPIMTI